jgi:type VI secretion system protein ImpJ
MSHPERILWGEGMFLLPQHFQQNDCYWEDCVADVAASVHAHPWGVRAITWDKSSLGRGLLQAEQLELTFQDGAAFRAPAKAPLPIPRQLADIPGLEAENLVYAVLPVWNAFGGNIESDTARGRLPRFRHAPHPTPDLFTTAVEGEVVTLTPNVALMVAGENRDGCLSVPVGRLLRTPTGTWAMDENFIPPLMELRGSEAAQRLVRRLVEILQVKAQSLSGSHRERVKSVADFGTSDVASYWLLHSVNRSFPLLNHALRFPSMHPETLYLALAQFASELLTFSSSATLGDLPSYDHDNLTGCFGKLDELIRSMLDTVISARFMLIPLSTPKPSMKVGRLDSDRLLEGVDFFLSVSGDQPAAFFEDEVPPKLKIGSPDDVEKILHSGLPGVRLKSRIQPPGALPVRVGNYYLALEAGGQIFERMLKARSICIYVPQTLPEFKIELYAVFT